MVIMQHIFVHLFSDMHLFFMLLLLLYYMVNKDA